MKGLRNGQTKVVADVFGVDGEGKVGVVCSSDAAVTVGSSGGGKISEAWWQVKDSDIQSQNDVSSKVPSGKDFNLAGAGGKVTSG